jgi:Beta-lactamase
MSQVRPWHLEGWGDAHGDVRRFRHTHRRTSDARHTLPDRIPDEAWTATLAMQLVDEGVVELDVPVRNYLADFTLADKDATMRTTLRHLLSHTGGFEELPGRKPRVIREGTVHRSPDSRHR